MPPSDHRFWTTLDRVIPLVFLGFLLWFNYDSVDARDMKTWIEIALSMFAGPAIRSLSSRE